MRFVKDEFDRWLQTQMLRLSQARHSNRLYLRRKETKEDAEEEETEEEADEDEEIDEITDSETSVEEKSVTRQIRSRISRVKNRASLDERSVIRHFRSRIGRVKNGAREAIGKMGGAIGKVSSTVITAGSELQSLSRKVALINRAFENLNM